MYQQFGGSFESIHLQYCPCEALEQKWDPKTKISSKDIELSFLFHSIRLDELVI